MKQFLLLLSVITLLCGGIAYGQGKDATPLAADPVLEQRLIAISEEMRCLVCQNESLAGSRSDLANDLRQQIRILIQEGKSDDQIRTYMVERYGDFVLYRPPVKPLTWLLWLGPFIALLLGIAALVLFQKRRSQEQANEVLTADQNRQIDAFLKETKHD
jgi:cytochrome c-type biogenesis protein CcmH